jgi:hypothetical protein
MSGFMNDEQIAAYVDGLDHERDGYEQRVKQAELAGDKPAVALYKNRIDQVDAEVARVAGLSVPESVEADADGH